MLIALDVGNTNVTVGIVEGGDVASSRSMPTRSAATADALATNLDELLGQGGVSLTDVREVVLCSVVPAVTLAVTQLAARHELELLVADEATIPITIRVDNPAAVGDDRLVNAYAALRLHGAPAIVVDMGTATTFDVVAADGAFVGGAIAAGAGLGLQALARGTAQLPRVPLVMPPSAIGSDTISAMQSGAVIGHSGLVHVLIKAISDELVAGGSPAPKVILTGGLSTTDWARAIPSVDVVDPYLTLEGLVRLHAEVRQSVGVRA